MKHGIKDIGIYRDGGTMEVKYEDGRIVYIASPMMGSDVWSGWPKKETSELFDRDTAIAIYAQVVEYYREQLHAKIQEIRDLKAKMT